MIGRVFGRLTVLEPVNGTFPDGKRRWRCRCSCGAEIVAVGTLLRAGRVSSCGKCGRGADITGMTFHALTALYATAQRQDGSVVWRCRCACGREVDVSYNRLLYSDVRSCGCRKREQEQALGTYLTHVGGTSLDMIRSRKLPADNTTGYKGVYCVGGKYKAKIVFQKKQYYLGVYSNPEDAADARREAERLLFDGTAAYYERWKARAKADPDWAQANPVNIHVSRDAHGALLVDYSPAL